MQYRKFPVDYCDTCQRDTGTDMYTGECGGCEMKEILRHRKNDCVTRTGSKEGLEPMTFWEYVFVLGATAVITLVVLGVLDMIVGWIY